MYEDKIKAPEECDLLSREFVGRMKFLRAATSSLDFKLLVYTWLFLALASSTISFGFRA